MTRAAMMAVAVVAAMSVCHADGVARPNRWLHVDGRFIVDASGKPFHLVGMGRYQPESGIANKLVGSIDEICQHYKQLGMNAMRIAVGAKNDWLPNCDVSKYGGFDGYIDKVVDPDVRACERHGMYVLLDLHAGGADEATIYNWFIPFWQAAARKYKDDPWIAAYELWNEPNLKPNALKPASAAPLRKWYAACIKAVRAIDQRHIILVSDWNAGWGSATEGQWEPVKFDPGDPVHQIAFSKHIAKDHCTKKFLDNWIDRVSRKWKVPILIGELELGGDIMDAAALERFGKWLRASDGQYGWFGWAVGAGFEKEWAPIAQAYASPVPGYPPVRVFHFEDFERPTNMASWTVQTGGNVPVAMDWVGPGVEGYGHCLRVAFGPHEKKGKGDWAQVYCCWIYSQRFGDLVPDRITFQLRGDGTPASVYRQEVCLSEKRFSDAEMYRAYVPLSDTRWHTVTLTADDFTPHVPDFRKIVRVTFPCVGENAKLGRKVEFEVDNIDFEQPIKW